MIDVISLVANLIALICWSLLGVMALVIGRPVRPELYAIACGALAFFSLAGIARAIS
jgi:hypothetical protein